MHIPLAIYLFMLLAYLMGSIPFGLLFVRWSGRGDIRDIGSGNIGATNVLRSGSKILALSTLLADVLKGAIPILVAKYIYSNVDEFDLCLIAFAAIVGHVFPLWLRFKGGKGVATALGCYFALNPMLGFLVMLTWIVMAKIVRISSLSALVAMFMAPIFTVFAGDAYEVTVYAIAVYLLIVWTHRDNIRRIMNGEESLMGGKSNGDAD